MGRVGLGDVDASLRALGTGQRALRALGGFVGLRVRRIGYRLMLMGAAVDLQRHAKRGIRVYKLKKIKYLSVQKTKIQYKRRVNASNDLSGRNQNKQ